MTTTDIVELKEVTISITIYNVEYLFTYVLAVRDLGVMGPPI